MTKLFVVARKIGLLVVHNGPLCERDWRGTYRSGQSSSMSSLSVISSRRIIAPSDRNSRLISPSIVCLTSAMIFVMSTGHRSKSQSPFTQIVTFDRFVREGRLIPCPVWRCCQQMSIGTNQAEDPRASLASPPFRPARIWRGLKQLSFAGSKSYRPLQPSHRVECPHCRSSKHPSCVSRLPPILPQQQQRKRLQLQPHIRSGASSYY